MDTAVNRCQVGPRSMVRGSRGNDDLPRQREHERQSGLRVTDSDGTKEVGLLFMLSNPSVTRAGAHYAITSLRRFRSHDLDSRRLFLYQQRAANSSASL